MDNKLKILLLLATVAQSSLAEDISSSCTGSSLVTEIGTSLATIQCALETARYGYARTAEIVHTEVLTILSEKSEGICDNSEEADSRAERAQNECLTVLLDGLTSLFEAYKILQPELCIPDIVNKSRTELQENLHNIFATIRIVRENEDHLESQKAVDNLSTAAQESSSALIDGSFSLMLNGGALIPDDAQDVIACFKAQATSQLMAASLAMVQQINLLLEALCNLDSADAIEEYRREITTVHEGMLYLYDAQINTTVNVYRNVVIADFLQWTGIVTGLFALQSASK